jgi:hypothetical protein
MEENDTDYSWTFKIDWLNILKILKLDKISDIDERKSQKAIKKLTKVYGSFVLNNFEPEELDEIVAEELKELLKNDIKAINAKKERLEKEIRSKIIPFKQGGIIKINPQDLKNFDGDPEKMLRYLKRFLGNDDDEDNDNDKYKEDNTGYYI